MRSGAQRQEAVLREFPPHPGERLATGAADLDDSPVNRHPAERAVHGRTALGFERSKESAALKGGPNINTTMCSGRVLAPAPVSRPENVTLAKADSDRAMFWWRQPKNRA